MARMTQRGIDSLSTLDLLLEGDVVSLREGRFEGESVARVRGDIDHDEAVAVVVLRADNNPLVVTVMWASK